MRITIKSHGLSGWCHLWLCRKIRAANRCGNSKVTKVDFLVILVISPIAAYLFYMGVKLLRPSMPELQDLHYMQGSGFAHGQMRNFCLPDGGDYRIRRGLEVSESGQDILEQGAISTNAVKTVYPY